MREPERWEREAKSRRGERTVSCQVSERYLSYDRTDAREISFGHPVVLRVMKDNYGDKPDRTLCELILSLEDLEVMVAQLRADITRSN